MPELSNPQHELFAQARAAGASCGDAALAAGYASAANGGRLSSRPDIKARILEFQQREPYFTVRIETMPDEEIGEITVETEALMRTVREQTEKILSLKGIMSSDLMVILNNIEEPGRHRAALVGVEGLALSGPDRLASVP